MRVHSFLIGGGLFKRDSLHLSYYEIDLPEWSNIYYARFDSDYEGNAYIGVNLSFEEGYRLYKIDTELTDLQRVQGRILLDENQNCVDDDMETVSSTGWKVQLYNNSGYASTQFINDGHFDFKVPQGIYNLRVIAPMDEWEVCELEYEIDLNVNNKVTQDFLVSADNYCADFDVSINTSWLLRRCRPAFYSINLTNNGTDNSSDLDVTIIRDSGLELVECSEPYTIVNDTTIRVNIESVDVAERKEIFLDVIPSCSRPLGYVHCVTAKVDTDNLCFQDSIICSSQYGPNIGPYDPNDMRVFNEQGYEKKSFEAQEYQYYHTRFQNTGTDTAFNVRVVSQVDAHLDFETIDMLSASHDYRIVTGDAGKLIMYFDNIMLPDSSANQVESNGYFKFRALPKSNVSIGQEMRCHSDIYFDYNAPIRTNETLVVIEAETCPVPTYSYEAVDICWGEDYRGFSTQGIYKVIRPSSDMCDTISIIDLTVNRTSYTTINKRACEGQVVGGFSENTVTQDTLINHMGLRFDCPNDLLVLFF